MKASNLIVASTVAVMCGLAPVRADTLRVPTDFITIQSAIDFAVDGDIVLVAPGLYVENIDFIGKDITVMSEDGPDVTIIDGNSTGPVVTFSLAEGPTAVLAGFTVQNGRASFGSGVTISSSSPTIVGNIFDGRQQQGTVGFASAIGGNVSSPAIERNIVRNHTCDNQSLSGAVIFLNGSSPLIANNIFENNECRAINFTLPSGTQPKVINNTFVGNRVGIRVDRRIDSTSQFFGNNIIVGNEIGFEVEFGSEDFNPTWEHNLVFGNGIDYDVISDQTGQNGNISADPMFARRSLSGTLTGDYRLGAGSPAIDAGANTFAKLPATDFNGYDRIFDGDGDGVAVADMGVFEFGAGPGLQITGTCPGTVEVTVSGAAPGGTVAFLLSASEGSFVVPRGPCVGAVFGLDAPTVRQTVIADGNGGFTTVETVGASACGLFIQVGDQTTCAPSNVAQVP